MTDERARVQPNRGPSSEPTERRLGDVMAESIERLADRSRMLPQQRIDELVRWRSAIIALVGRQPGTEADSFDDFVENFATTIVEGLPAMAVRKFFRRMQRKKERPHEIRTGFLQLLTVSAKRLSADCGVAWGGRPKPR